MEYAEYQRRVLARASHRWHNDKVPIGALETVLKNFIYWGNALDRVKKSLMYGRDFYITENESLHGDTVSVIPEEDQRLFHAMIGTATEGVEMMEASYAYFFNNDSFDYTNLQEEFGDAEWYRAFGLSVLGQSHEENINQNDAKLELRYGSTFTEEAANTRNLERERSILEGHTENRAAEVGTEQPEAHDPEAEE